MLVVATAVQVGLLERPNRSCFGGGGNVAAKSHLIRESVFFVISEAINAQEGACGREEAKTLK